MKTGLDTLIGRVTMYRLVTLSLALLAVIAFAFSAVGQISYTPADLGATLATLLVATVVSSKIFAGLFRVPAHSESSVITALLLFFILVPTTDITTLTQIALAGIFASASKYLLAIRGRHIFNPAAVGAVWLSLFHLYLAYWWIGTPVMLPFTAVLAIVVLYRTRRLPLGAVFVVVAGLILLSRNLIDGQTLAQSAKFAFAQTPMIFLAGFMLSEPLTLPPARWQQLTVAVVVAVLFAVPITIGSYLLGPEAALVIGNAVAFGFGQRRAVALVLTARKQLSPTSMEFSFAPTRDLSFRAGQYLELSVPHRRADSRGTRRAFSITSAPADRAAVRIGMKVPEKASSFKRSLQDMPIGRVVRATGIFGDFVLPRDPSKPLLLVAGGIGITPFVSQLSSLPADHGRDIVLIYAAGTVAEVNYRDELAAAGVRTVVLTRDGAAGLPDAFESVTADRLDRELLDRAVPDVADRHVFISGPPALVDAINRAARSLHAKSIDRDYFSGY